MSPTFYLCFTISLFALWTRFYWCLSGPAINTPGMPVSCSALDLDADGDVDLKDVATLLNGEW